MNKVIANNFVSHETKHLHNNGNNKYRVCERYHYLLPYNNQPNTLYLIKDTYICVIKDI